jgi:hypothetical protein
MRSASFVKVAVLAMALAAPLGGVAFAGDHSGDQWRSDDDGRKVATTYAQAAPALVRMEQHVYRADTQQAAPQTASSAQIERLSRADLG